MLKDKKLFWISLPVLEIILLQFTNSKTSSLFFRTLKAVLTHFKNHSSNSLLFSFSLIDFNAIRRFPKPLAAAEEAVALPTPFLIKNSSIFFLDKRPSFDVWHLERRVSAIRSVDSQTKIKSVSFGGSSISLSNLLVAVMLSFSAIQIIVTFQPPSYDFSDIFFTRSSTSSLPIFPCLFSTPIFKYQSSRLP